MKKGVVFVIIFLLFGATIFWLNERNDKKEEVVQVERSFSIIDLLLTAENLTPEWILTREASSWDDDKVYFSKEGASIAFTLPGVEDIKVILSQNIFDYYSDDYAQAMYDDGFELIPGEIPVGWTYQSEVADQQKVSRFDRGGNNYEYFFWVGRYEEFIVKINLVIYPDLINLDDFEEIVRQVDNIFKEKLGEDNLE